MNKVSYLIDGFNLYHSIVQLNRDTGYKLKWLNIYALCKSYIYMFGREAVVGDIYYFTALPYFQQSRDPGKIQRQKSYLNALKSTDIFIEEGRFKEKKVDRGLSAEDFSVVQKEGARR